MPKFAANLSMMFNEVPFLDRFAAAAEAGFKGVEYLFPYEFPVEEIASRLSQYNLENVLFNLPPGNWATGDRGTTCVPGREDEFRAGVEKALFYATRLGLRRLHAMAGLAPSGVDAGAIEAAYISNLRYAADQMAPHGITLLIEAINTRDIPGFYLNTQAQSFATCAAVNRPNIRMQMDLYHAQIMEGDLEMKLRKYAAQCGHIQIAGVPKRQEPDAGEINYPYLYRVIDEIGYTGWIGCEYKPAGKTLDGLGWWKAAGGSGA